MFSFEMEDVISVLQKCAPYLIGLGVALAIGIVLLIVVRKLPKPTKFLARAEAGIAMLLAVLIAVNGIMLNGVSALLDLALADTSDSEISEETTAEAEAAAIEIAEEGFVLLQNDDDTLPLTDVTSLNLFGWAASNPVYGGTGSGGINDLYDIVTLQQGLEDAGFEVNQSLLDFYTEYSDSRPDMTITDQTWTLYEPPVSTYSDELLEEAKEFSDVAVIVIARLAGEGHNDMPMSMGDAGYENNSDEYDDFEDDDHYLQLSRTEEDLVEMVCENFDTVIVLVNSANAMELGFVEEYEQIKSVIWCPGPGNVGFEALGEIIRGTVNPSGKTTDSFPYDLKESPWWNNYEIYNYSNMEDLAVEGMNSGVAQTYYPSFTSYVEGIYVGYKYWETAATEGFIDYDTSVQYPFGYGLSYTTFAQEMSDLTVNGTEISFTVTVTNTGTVAGKDVVEVYYNPPYYNGGVEKSSANLLDFEKTDELEPGDSQTITFTFDIEDMASYDYEDAEAYILDAGDYIISINSDSHTILDQRTYTLDEKIVYDGEDGRSSDEVTATNLFDDAAGDVEYLSRADCFANWDTATAAPESTEMSEELQAEYHLNSNFDYTTYLDDSIEMPTTGADNGLTLADMRGLDYDDPLWEDLLDQLTIDEMSNMIALSGYQTPAMDSVGKVQTLDMDGPAAINNNFTGYGSIGFPVEVVIANTWSKEMATAWGSTMAQMCVEMGIEGWYAPGMNTHRSPFGGRNYEYFSEDGVLAGKIAAAAVSAAKEKGVYAYIKHFAAYDFNGKMVCVWTNEQALREIYLKPFEISVKEGGASAVMVSWSFLGIKWVGENSSLINTVLRDEWGFEGMVLTDFFRNNGHGFMNADAALANGVDAMLATVDGGPNFVTDTSDASSVYYMRRACKNVMYTVVNSWAYDEDHIDSGTGSGWKTYVYVADAVVIVLLIGLEVLTIRGYRKRRQAK
ncbi:MAG: glycoside hydrolase family 3 C-terminal domain-containing protein [Clostridiales bacterium]|nr:glycoside hydrolase family 3 C-terminal domain-containing protein [Clostridiales bacterium]